MNYNIITYILKNLHSDITIEKLSEDLDCSISTCARLIDYKNPYKRSPNSIKHDTYLNTFLKYKKEYFQDSSEYAIITIIKILKNINYDISEIELKLISPLENYDYISFVGFLLKKASDFYKFSANNGFNVYSSTEKESIKFNTYFDLRNQGLSAKDMILQLIKNNYTLYKDSEEHAGSIEQWMEHLTTHPENWGFLCIGNKIIGNYSFIFLTKEQEESIMKGTYLESQLTLSISADIHEYQTDEQVIYLLNMSINDGYQTIANHDMLWSYFGKRLHQLTPSGIFYKGIYTLVKRLDHQKTFMKMGFEFLVDNYYKGSVYYLNLMKKHLDPISWIMPEEPLNDNVIFKQLSYKDILTNQQLIDIASLIWDDDDYISPSMMSREQAKKILPLVFSTNKDVMYSLDNIFVAMCGRRIIGLILHKKGPLNWSSTEIKKTAKFFNEELPDSLSICESNYFSRYNSTPPDTTLILAGHVHSNWRLRDISVESKMVSEFIANHNETILTYILRETLPFIRAYARNGFEIQESINGFSIDDHALPCALMIKPAK